MTAPRLLKHPTLWLTALLWALGPIFTAACPANAEERFEFLAPPDTTSNRIYRVDTQTGAMAVCWFNGTHTECMNGTGAAGPQKNGSYGLRRSARTGEKGVFRVNQNTGAVSNCWIRDGVLVCTIPVR